MGFPIQEIGQATGLELYGEPGPFMSKSGTLMGFKRNFLFAVGLRGQDNRICILARFKSAPDGPALINSLKAEAAMKKVYTIADIKLSGPQSVLWSFASPMRFKVQEFAMAVEAMASLMAQYAQAFDTSKCESERCGTPIHTLTLANGIPNLMCAGCMQKVAAEQERAREEYERREPNVLKALVFGLGAAVAAGVLAAALMYWDISGDNRYSPKLFICLTLLIGGAVAWAVKAGVRNVTYGACVLAGALSAVGKAIADVLFYGLYFAHLEKWPVNAALFGWSAANLWALKWDFNAFVAVCDVASIALAGFICWGLRPKFNVTFKSVPMPPGSAKPATVTMTASV